MPIGKYYMQHPYHTIGQGIINYKKLINTLKKNIIIDPLLHAIIIFLLKQIFPLKKIVFPIQEFT